MPDNDGIICIGEDGIAMIVRIFNPEFQNAPRHLIGCYFRRTPGLYFFDFEQVWLSGTQKSTYYRLYDSATIEELRA